MRAVHGGIIGRGNCLINVVQVAGVYRDAETGQYCPLLSPDIKRPFFFRMGGGSSRLAMLGHGESREEFTRER